MANSSASRVREIGSLAVSERDWDMWNQEIGKDSAEGKLDFLIEEALEEKRKGKLGKL